MPSRAKIYMTVLVLGLAAILGGFAIYSRHSGDSRDATGPGVAAIGGSFALTDHAGRRVTDADYRGRYMLIFFGYTYCPDVCPTELQVMTHALDTMGAAGERIAPVFITVDPERDTVEQMKSYVENFSPRLVGLTGTPEEIAAVAKAYRVYYAKSGKADAADYLVDHSSIIYLMDTEGRFLKHFTYTTDAKALAESLAALTSTSP